jgi:hypothetical protein
MDLFDTNLNKYTQNYVEIKRKEKIFQNRQTGQTEPAYMVWSGPV